MKFGWRIDAQENKVYIYRPHEAVRCVEHPMTIAGEPLPPRHNTVPYQPGFFLLTGGAYPCILCTPTSKDALYRISYSPDPGLWE